MVAPEADWLNWDRALRVVDGDAMLLQRLVRIFAEQFGETSALLTAAAASGDWARLGQRAHQLAGAAGAIGAEGLDQLARRLERAAQQAQAAVQSQALAQAQAPAPVPAAAAAAAAAAVCERLDTTLAGARAWLAAERENPD
jgi:HPt (histidine-containing phosphotransfer) domain-containing protein